MNAEAGDYYPAGPIVSPTFANGRSLSIIAILIAIAGWSISFFSGAIFFWRNSNIQDNSMGVFLLVLAIGAELCSLVLAILSQKETRGFTPLSLSALILPMLLMPLVFAPLFIYFLSGFGEPVSGSRAAIFLSVMGSMVALLPLTYYLFRPIRNWFDSHRQFPDPVDPERFPQPSIRPGDTCLVLKDVVIDGEIALRCGDRALVELCEQSDEHAGCRYSVYRGKRKGWIWLAGETLARVRDCPLEPEFSAALMNRTAAAVTIAGAIAIQASALVPFYKLSGDYESSRLNTLLPFVTGLLLMAMALRAVGLLGRHEERGERILPLVLSGTSLCVGILLSLHLDSRSVSRSNHGLNLFLFGAFIAVCGSTVLFLDRRRELRSLKAPSDTTDSPRGRALGAEAVAPRLVSIPRFRSNPIEFCPNCGASVIGISPRCRECHLDLYEKNALRSLICGGLSWGIACLGVLGNSLYVNLLHGTPTRLYLVWVAAAVAMAGASISFGLSSKAVFKKNPEILGRRMAESGLTLGVGFLIITALLTALAAI